MIITTEIKGLTEKDELAKALNRFEQSAGDYSQVTVTATEGEESASVSFLWHKQLLWLSKDVQDAREKAENMARETLARHLANKPKAKNFGEKVIALFRREFKHLTKMTRIG